MVNKIYTEELRWQTLKQKVKERKHKMGLQVEMQSPQ